MFETSEEYYKKIIKEKSDEILKRLEGAYLYGMEVNSDSISMIVYAVYMLGKTDGQTMFTYSWKE